MKISAAILAGGKNSRFGGYNKAFFDIAGKKLCDLQIEVLKKYFNNIFVVSNDPLAEFGVPSTKDIFISAGPLGGIHAALEFSGSDNVFVFSCDMPFLSGDLIEKMIENMFSEPCDALIPVHEKGIEPLHAIYSKNIMPPVINLLENTNHKIKLLFDDINMRYFHVDETFDKNRIFFNVNDDNDLKKAQDYAKGIN